MLVADLGDAVSQCWIDPPVDLIEDQFEIQLGQRFQKQGFHLRIVMQYRFDEI